MLSLNKNHVSCPDLYNHIHYFKLINENSLEFAVGGGASVLFSGSCEYTIEKVQQARQSNILFTHEISLFNFHFEEDTKYPTSNIDSDILTKKVRFFEETGNFFFVDFDDMYNNPKEEDELPCIKFDKRIVFESDLLFVFEDQYQHSAYGQMRYPSFVQKLLPDNYYYSECTGTFKLKQIKELGIKCINY
jgi:hypothetical protein